MIELKHVTKKFNGKVALSDISFSVSEGEIFGFLGPSGAGKTTTINILTGQLVQDSGQAFILGKDAKDISADDLLNIGFMSDTVGFYEKMSLYKNLEFFAKFHNVSTEVLDHLLRELDLYQDKDKKAENLIETEKENKNRKREDKLKEIIKGYPIFEMIPYLVERDEKTAALLVAIARKESTWGVHAPSKNGQDCYNYWGYKGNYNLVKGYSCFDSPKQAVEVVGDKIDQLIAKKIDTPEELVVWKCGSSCAGHDPESVHSWVKSVREYWEKILG